MRKKINRQNASRVIIHIIIVVILSSCSVPRRETGGPAKTEIDQNDISPYMNSLYNACNRDRLYDYMRLVSQKVTDFYENYDKVLNDNGLFSRGQCSGAPCDIISAYSKLDIPEGEAMLYEPEYFS